MGSKSKPKSKTPKIQDPVPVQTRNQKISLPTQNSSTKTAISLYQE